MTWGEIERQTAQLSFSIPDDKTLIVTSSANLSAVHQEEWLAFLRSGYPSREIKFINGK